MDSLERYLAWQREHNPALPTINATLRFAVDCSGGMSSLLARALFPQAVLLNDTLDGTFACHAPNPLKAEAREQLSACVRAHGLDCGVIFDGDADRAMFVDETGAFVQPDYLIPLVAHATPHKPGETVIHDVRTSRGAIETLVEMGFVPQMVPVGHAFAKPALRARGAVCGGELAGHYYFREFFACDSGVLAALRILAEIADAKAHGLTFSARMRPIVSRYANSGERNYRVADKDAAITRILAACAVHLPPERARSTIDGVRLEYDAGWVNVRKSNTEPYLRLLVECDTVARLADWLNILEETLKYDS